MTEKTKQIFADGAKLREKLGIYLQTPEKVEIYAQAAEKMFAKTGGTSIGFAPTWSWWGFFCGGLFFLYRKLYLFGIVCIILSPILSIIIWVVSALIAKYTVIKDFEKKLDLDNDLALATGVNKWAVIYVFIALVVIVILAEIIGGADESKAPQIVREGIHIYAISQDDNTIIDGVTVSGRNGKCEKQSVIAYSLWGGHIFKDMETCEKESGDMACKPLFDGKELAYHSSQVVYKLGNCPPKNGVWKIELETNFGTYEYELQDK